MSQWNLGPNTCATQPRHLQTSNIRNHIHTQNNLRKYFILKHKLGWLSFYCNKPEYLFSRTCATPKSPNILSPSASSGQYLAHLVLLYSSKFVSMRINSRCCSHTIRQKSHTVLSMGPGDKLSQWFIHAN